MKLIWYSDTLFSKYYARNVLCGKLTIDMWGRRKVINKNMGNILQQYRAADVSYLRS
jgi:hypothetical protein